MPTQRTWKFFPVCVTLALILTLTLCNVEAKTEATRFTLTEEGYSASSPIRNLAFDDNGTIYVGAKNYIFALDPDSLNVTRSTNTCPGSAKNCGNENLVLEVYQKDNEDILLTCGTMNGSCERRSLSDLTVIRSSKDKIASSTVVSNVAQFAKVDKNKLLLFYARRFANFPTDKDQYLPIRAMSFSTSAWSLKPGYSLQFIPSTSNIPDLDYKAVMDTVDFIFFLSNQKNYLSKLSKLCKHPQNSTDEDTVYEEIYISCSDGKKTFPFVRDGVVLKDSNGDFVLVVLFTETNVSSSDHTEKGAICVYREAEVLQEFLNSRMERFLHPCLFVSRVYLKEQNACYHENITSISTYEPMTYPKFCNVETDVAFVRVIGKKSLNGNASLVLKGAPTKLAVSQSYLPSVYVNILSPSNSKLLQYWLDEDENFKLKLENEISLGRFAVIVDMEVVQNSVYIATSTTVERRTVDGDCSSFTNCSSCVNSNMPKCGWCLFENKCTEGGPNFCGRVWLPALRKQCLLDLKIKSPPKEEISSKSNIKPQVMLPKTVNLTGLNLKCQLKNIENKLSNESENNRYRTCGELSISDITDLKEGFLPLKIIASNQGERQGGIAIASVDIYFFNCSRYLTCYDCLGDENKSCRWNYEEGKCKRSSPTNVAAVDVMECPHVNGGGTEKLLSGKTTNLTFNGAYLFNVHSYKCTIENTTYNADVANDTLICKNVLRNMSTQPQKYLVNFTQIVNGITRVPMETLLEGKLSSAMVEVYTCEGLLRGLNNSNSLKDCSSCKYFGSQGYNCDWCGSSCMSSSCDIDNCEAPQVSDIKPNQGPKNGGTIVTISGINLGHEVERVSVTIGRALCRNLNFTAKRRLTCITGKSNETGVFNVAVKVNMENRANLNYTYVEPKLNRFCNHRNQGIRSGGGRLCIIGPYISTGNKRINVQLIGKDGTVVTCKNPVLKPLGHPDAAQLSCKTPEVSAAGDYNVSVSFDNNTEVTLQNFKYVDNPDIQIPSKMVSIQSGGVKQSITAKGSFDFSIISQMYITVGSSNGSCTGPAETDKVRNVIRCTYPPYDFSKRRRRKREATQQLPVELYLDGLRIYLNTVEYKTDPEFNKMEQVFQYNPKSDVLLQLLGRDLTLVVNNTNFYTVTIGSGICTIKTLNNTILECKPPGSKPAPLEGEEQLTVKVKYALGRRDVTLGYVEYKAELQLLMIIAIAISLVLIIIVLVTVLVVLRVKRKSQREINSLLNEIQALEEKTREEGKEEFATMQLTITDIKADLVSVGIPYHDYETFVLNVLFPTVEQASFKEAFRKDVVLQPCVKSAMDRFETLLRNKFFMKSLIQTLERQKRITMQDKAQFSSLLSIVLIGRMKDFFDIVQCLLSNLVDSTPKKQHRVLFNRFENISLRLLINWLSIAMYPSFKDSGGGTSLFMLYKAILTVVEKRPVDDVTGDAKNTLSYDRFLGCKVDFKIMSITIDLNGDGHEFLCEVLDCDTISQVKQKCLRQIYKNRPASQMPSIDEVTLEWRMGNGKLALNDFDQTSEREGNQIRKNTLKHYNVRDKSRMELSYKFSPAAIGGPEEEDYANYSPASPSDVTINMPTMVTEENLEKLQKWHLAEPYVTDDDAVRFEGRAGRVHLAGDKGNHITNLMHTKLILTEYIRAFFGQILDNNIPTVVHYLFNVLDNLAKTKNIDQDTQQCWKSESYAIRIWATLTARPDTLFDVDKPKHIEPCLDSIRTLLIDCFHSTKITKDSSLQKLLFATEVPDYQNKVDVFYKILSQAANIGEDKFADEMTKLSSVQHSSLNFRKLPALQKLYKFIQTYMDDILEDLDDDDEAKDLHLRAKLEDIIENMDKDD